MSSLPTTDGHDATIQGEWWRINMLFSPPVTLIGCSNIHVPCASLFGSRNIYLIIIFFKSLSSYCFLPRRSLQPIVLLLLGVGCVTRSIFLTCAYVLRARCTRVKIFVLRTWTYLISNKEDFLQSIKTTFLYILLDIYDFM